ncbi:hypothetical protein KLAF111653_08150 [Klebsiella africana]|uniref:Uncharacterized protein n=1 Tax=Klebsiella africana TaxID=2489010 RepID=A0A8B6IQP6_9ENTR|nr:hypothetical protein SB5857_02002 [Klebsiella africana]
MSLTLADRINYKGTFWVPFFNCSFFKHNVHLLVTIFP